jgi:sodium transport system ATP-binding protein
MIELNAISKRYDQRAWALQDLSLSIPAGQIFGILGPNGAGKTTLLRILSTLLKPDQGQARVAGFDVVQQATQVRQTLGLLNNDMGLYPRLSGRENLEFFATLHGARDVAQRIRELQALLHIEDWIEQRVGGYSTGMRQKINIARAILHRPKVLILDEASNGLDVMARVALIAAARQHAEAGHLVLYSTHIMSEAQSLCPQLAIILQGRLVAHGSTETLIAQHGGKDLEQAFLHIAERHSQITAQTADDYRSRNTHD